MLDQARLTWIGGKTRMNNTKLMQIVLTVCLLTITSAVAQAQATRTFVASTGMDANTATNCGRAAPCRNFSAAVSVTSKGGEVEALDTAGFGEVTITQGITISAAPGQGGLIAVSAGTVGVFIETNDLVILRNLQISGAGAANTIGVQVGAGNQVLQGCRFTQLTTGLTVARSRAYLVNCDFAGNGIAVSANGPGTDNSTVVSTTMVTLGGGSVVGNGIAFFETDPGVNLANIWLQLSSNSSGNWFTNVVGNGTVLTGTGTGCPGPPPILCSGAGGYFGNFGVK
jgi:hypothetical protein